MKKQKLILFLPDYWSVVFNSITTELKYSKKKYDWDLMKDDLDVDFTGVDGEAYKPALEAMSKGYLPILVLPISHCAINIDKYKLAIVGPAYKTINDIYLIRTRNRPISNTYEIGVRELELTTSNISRIIFHHHFNDRFFFSEIENINHTHCEIVKNIHHKQIPNSRKRMEALQKNEINAGIFMGHELNTLDLFHKEDFIIAANLNRIICNIYNVKFFPRSVFAVFNESINKDNKYYLDQFIDEYSYFVKEMNETEYKSIEKFHPDITHFACETGKYSKMEDIQTQILFTRDIAHDDFHSERGAWVGRKNGFNINDYLYSDDITRTSRLKDLISSIEELDIADCFTLNEYEPRIRIIKTQLIILVSKANHKITENQNSFTYEYLLDLVKALNQLTSDEKVCLINYLSEKWN
jgi:hypothetical protein